MKYSLMTVALAAEAVSAFPFVADMPGVDSRMLRRQQSGGANPGGPLTCPNNPNHVAAPGITAEFPYGGAMNGSEGTGIGGYLVPAIGDTAHEFIAPTEFDIRGPCPGLNTAANHNFLARDGITTFDELVDAQQNLYNVGFDLSTLLAALGLTLTTGDIVTERLSIGCDATTRTSFSPLLTGSQPGLSGHNKFEADSSLTRDDFFLGKGDNFSFNMTLFEMMQESTGKLYDRDGMAKFRYERYQQSLNDNPNFYFGPLSLLLFGASSFLYELMPSGPDYIPDDATISSFFLDERIPDNWTNRITPYSNRDVTIEILAQYLQYPVLFGGATGNGGFNLLDHRAISNGTLAIAVPDGPDLGCLLFQLSTDRIPTSLNGVLAPGLAALNFVAENVAPQFENLGCPQPLT